ncbi:hypothetical protein GGTG_13978 [Gaeumannomyces tritici R3-111a-1]|uniref:Uncharacterized protein n=1 Tax=Gaeumannomyces tritici (strain R3-111a-1) TaxID=644352 RepID=J3PKC5_GAET3|nr:hypothetical protein GGTG_13978 [Gaeumannomyces tritici R3-111a-1]EJT68446.1 hypothetical protein GGTG_13978 [Gaeumannomyces tritici R3-111a-1]
MAAKATKDFILIDELYSTYVQPPFDFSKAICNLLAGFLTPELCNARAKGKDRFRKGALGPENKRNTLWLEKRVNCNALPITGETARQKAESVKCTGETAW